MTSMIQKECAACGKLFQPKGRERYCPGPHYKPCPVCGELVVATYWSDPPKRCDKCRAANAKPVQPSQTAETKVSTTSTISSSSSEDDNLTRTIDLGDNNVRKYIGPDCPGVPFKNGHSYILTMEKEEKYGCYVVRSTYDITAEETIDAYIRYSSMNSINRYFEQAPTGESHE